MTPESIELFRAVVSADASAVDQALAAGADVNATDELGRSVLSYAALGPAINVIETVVRPRLTEKRLEVLLIVSQHLGLSLYSLNAPLAWAGGVTLLGLMSWLNMPSEIMCLLESTAGLIEVNAMDEQGATPLMYAVRDGHLQVVQRLLAHGARPELTDVSQRSAVYYALQHPQIVWLCEQTLRRSRKTEATPPGLHVPRRRKIRPNTPFPSEENDQQNLFFRQSDRFLTPPPATLFDAMEIKSTFEAVLVAIRNDDPESVRALLSVSSSRDKYPVKRTTTTGSFTGTPILVNLRDETGLALVHHAVSQRRLPNPAVVDALYHTGADVGLYSTLGFTPLHHLARTARDDTADVVNRARGSAGVLTITEIHPLYAFTVHLIRDLRASLGATDSRGETPLHAAAEHGRSVAVLRAMLDCDDQLHGKGAAGEARNERGLRAVDVAKPEFLALFQIEQPSYLRSVVPPPINTSTKNWPPYNKDKEPSAYNSPTSPHPGTVSVDLPKKLSDTSLLSKSSSCSGSSGDQSSYLGPAPSQRLPRRRTSTPFFSTPPASLAGSPPIVQETQSVIDVATCTADILYNLSFCASALHAYSQPHADFDSLPDILSLSDTLHFSRELASHVLDHWTTRLEAARSRIERTRWESEKAAGLLKWVNVDVNALSVRPAQRERRTQSFRLGDKSRSSKLEALPVPKTQGDELEYINSSMPSDRSSSNVKAQPQLLTRRRSTMTFNVRDPRSPTPGANPGSVPFGALPKVEVRDPSSVSSTARPGAPRHGIYPDINKRDEFPDLRSIKTHSNALKSAPMVLERAHRDLAQIQQILASIDSSLKNSHSAILQAQDLVEGEIMLREDQLLVIRRIYGYDHSAYTSRLSTIEERSSESGHTRSTASSVVLSTHILEEPEVLRQLLIRGLHDSIEGIFEEIKRAHVWSRVIREVLRGLHRRILISS